MNNISDIIAKFIITNLEDEDVINLSRNELADYFNCAPSQINYVLSTRFTVNRGYLIESKRGGGGYIKLVKLKPDNKYFTDLIKNIGKEIDYNNALQILDNLFTNHYITKCEYSLLSVVLTDKALQSPIKNESKTRANILKSVLTYITQKKED